MARLRKPRFKPDPTTRARALEALYEMRSHGMSIRQAARRSHTTATTVQKYLPRALKRTATGKFVATKFDRYVRRMHFLTSEDQIEVSIRDSRTASKIAEYSGAVDYYLKTGKTDRLRPFRKQFITVGNIKYPFITDPRTLRLLQERGVVQYEDLYATI